MKFKQFFSLFLVTAILFAYIVPDIAFASNDSDNYSQYIIIENDDEGVYICDQDYVEVIEDPPSPEQPDPIIEEPFPVGPVIIDNPKPKLPGIPLPTDPTVKTFSISENQIIESVEVLNSEDGCNYVEEYVEGVNYNNSIPYSSTGETEIDEEFDDINVVIKGDQLQLWFLLPVVVPIVARVGGRLVVKQFLKSTTRSIVIRNGHLAGKRHPVTKVSFTSQGFPNFAEKFSMTLPNRLLKSSNSTQFAHANKALKSKVNRSSSVKSKFTSNQIKDIQNGKTPRGYTWHHHEKRGRMELVNASEHAKTGHTGGKSIWGKN